MKRRRARPFDRGMLSERERDIYGALSDKLSGYGTRAHAEPKSPTSIERVLLDTFEVRSPTRAWDKLSHAEFLASLRDARKRK